MLTTVAAGRVFHFSHCLGMYGMAGLGFWDPLDFAFGANGVLYVVNRGAEELGQRISKCTVNHEFLTQFGGFGTREGQFVWPVSVDVDQEERVYVSDENLHRIAIFSKDGQFQSQWGTPGTDVGALRGPSGIAFDRHERLHVVDSLNHRVQVFSKDGHCLGTWGRVGHGPGEFNMPWGICVDQAGDVYVADWKNARVQKFSPDGVFRLQFSGTDTGVGELKRPSGVAVDADGDVYVTDWEAHRVQVYAPDGTFITSLLGDAQVPSPWAQTYLDANPEIIKQRRRVDLEPEWRFRRPVAVNVDATGQIFVLESVRHRFQVYQKEKEYEEAALNL